MSATPLDSAVGLQHAHEVYHKNTVTIQVLTAASVKVIVFWDTATFLTDVLPSSSGRSLTRLQGAISQKAITFRTMLSELQSATGL
jgi:hypothetical protein